MRPFWEVLLISLLGITIIIICLIICYVIGKHFRNRKNTIAPPSANAKNPAINSTNADDDEYEYVYDSEYDEDCANGWVPDEFEWKGMPQPPRKVKKKSG